MMPGMPLHEPPRSDARRQLHYNITGFTGWDVFIQLLPRQMRVNALARRIWKMHGARPDFVPGSYSFTMPDGGTYFVTQIGKRVVARQT